MACRFYRWTSAIGAALMVGIVACGQGKEKASEAHEENEAHEASEQEEGGLTAFEVENGIGPIKEAIVVGPIDSKLASQGEQIFTTKCSACHKLGEKYVGPALGQVTQRRTPTYVMNMMLNPQEMYERHPVAKDLLAQYMTQMPNLSLTGEEARAIVEYLMQQASQGPAN